MKAKIRIEWNGKTYRVGKSHDCNGKRSCDLFRPGVCDIDCTAHPCDAINDAFYAACGSCPSRCFKEVRNG